MSKGHSEYGIYVQDLLATRGSVVLHASRRKSLSMNFSHSVDGPRGKDPIQSIRENKEAKVELTAIEVSSGSKAFFVLLSWIPRSASVASAA